MGVPYKRQQSDELTAKMLATLDQEDRDGYWLLTAKCPVCAASITRRVRQKGFTADRATKVANLRVDRIADVAPPEIVSSVTIRCECGEEHEGRPDDATGCGWHGGIEVGL